jgi:hypothetical protein
MIRRRERVIGKREAVVPRYKKSIYFSRYWIPGKRFQDEMARE